MSKNEIKLSIMAQQKIDECKSRELPTVTLFESEATALVDELEMTADKLSDVWLNLDSWALGLIPNDLKECQIVLAFIKDSAKRILRKQKAPGWKE